MTRSGLHLGLIGLALTLTAPAGADVLRFDSRTDGSTLVSAAGFAGSALRANGETLTDGNPDDTLTASFAGANAIRFSGAFASPEPRNMTRLFAFFRPGDGGRASAELLLREVVESPTLQWVEGTFIGYGGTVRERFGGDAPDFRVDTGWSSEFDTYAVDLAVVRGLTLDIALNATASPLPASEPGGLAAAGLALLAGAIALGLRRRPIAGRAAA